MTQHCCTPEVSEAGAAIIIEHSVDSVTAGIRRLFSMNDNERERIGMNRRQLVERKFQWSSVAQQMAAVYDWILGVSPRPQCDIS